MRDTLEQGGPGAEGETAAVATARVTLDTAASSTTSTSAARVAREGAEGLDDATLLEVVAGAGFGASLDGDPVWTRFSVHEWLVRLGRPATERDVVRAARLVAAFELGRRGERARRRLSGLAPIDGPLRALEWFAPHFRGERQECFAALLLDGRHRVLRLAALTRGTLTTSLVHPREVFGPAVREGAAAVLVAHNHPSGDPEPSPEDLAVTERLGRAGRLLGIPLVDHLVVAGPTFRSLRRSWSGWGRFADPPEPAARAEDRIQVPYG
ncbi:MAG: JAB domain-containing protein [Planctomycetota bacterium]